MKKETFDQFWENVIIPNAEKYTKHYPKYLFFDKNKKYTVWESYEKARAFIHVRMADPDGRIDRHKIGAALLYAILINKPFTINFFEKEPTPVAVLMIDELFGLGCALSIVYAFILDEANREGKSELVEIFKDGFSYPDCGSREYRAILAKSIFVSKSSNVFDFFLISNILFLIEEYTYICKKPK